MSHPRTPADRRNDLAADRDDAADRRDDIAHDRDDAADQRDTAAATRDRAASVDSHDLVDHVRRLCEQILARLARLENATVDPTAWPDLTSAAFAHLEAHTAEQRRLASFESAAVRALLDQLYQVVGRTLHDRHAAADRRAAARDRERSAVNRTESGQDRDGSARDRSQATIEREQVDTRDFPPTGAANSLPGPRPGGRSARDDPATFSERAIATSQQRISDSQKKITRARRAIPTADAARPDTPQG